MKTLLFVLVLIHPMSFAELDKASKEGLEKTQNLLQNKSERDEAVKSDPKAKETDQKVEVLTGKGANKEEIYSIAAKVMEKITAEANGDPDKMQKLLQEAEKNPEAFYNKYFSAEEKARTRGLAEKIGTQKSGSSRP